MAVLMAVRLQKDGLTPAEHLSLHVSGRRLLSIMLTNEDFTC